MFRDPFPIVYVADMERSLAFYRDGLGFVPVYTWPEDGGPPLFFVSGELGGGSLALSTTDRGAPVAGSPERFELCLLCEDVDAAAERLRALGAEQLSEPEDMPWGERLVFFADPDGNRIHIRTPIATP